MTDASIYFLPWMRRGVGGLITGAANEHGIPESLPSALIASVSVGANEAQREVQLQGPEVVIGLNESEVLRCYPAQGSIDVESNDFVHIEIKTPDLPWMFTPASPKNDRLIPWLALVVVEERDGVTYSMGTPLPVLTVDEAELELPPLNQAFAWAHVQCAAGLDSGIDVTFTENPNAFMARLISPRRLKKGTWYRACLVPTFASGRDAGLGHPVDSDAGTVALAWEADDQDVQLPVYYSWRFRTSEEKGDFETLVSVLKPFTLPPHVGMHPLDIGDAGSAMLPEKPGVTTGYRGAFVSPNLKPPEVPPTFWQLFQEGLRKMLNEGAETPAGEVNKNYDALKHDPVVAPPLYGGSPAGVDAIKKDDSGWLPAANLDPADRTVAGLGSFIVRRLQETLMAEAWEQAAQIREANALLNRTRLALEVGKRLSQRVDALKSEQWLQWSRGAHARLKLPQDALTFHGEVLNSAVPRGVVSAAFRRRFRNGTPVNKAYSTSANDNDRTMTEVLSGDFVQKPRQMLSFANYTVPPGIVWNELVQDFLAEESHQRQAEEATATVSRRTVSPRLNTQNAAQKLPVLQNLDTTLTPERRVNPFNFGAGKEGDELTASVQQARRAMDPAKLLATRIRAIIQLPGGHNQAPVPAELRVDPEIVRPLYRDLVQEDPELIMPGISSLPNNSIALAALNTAFIESFLLGANYELGREFTWREYPCNPRSTWLRTFWDAITLEGSNEHEASTDADITPIDTWKPKSALGKHSSFNPDQTMVLIIRGDLLQRYPNTIIYAAPAKWVENTTSKKWERMEDESKQPVMPSLIGKLTADVTFIGFEFPEDVDVDDDLVGSPKPPGKGGSSKKAGWFFAFEQIPEEPQFGLDTGKKQQQGKVPNRWENLTWAHAHVDQETAYVDLDVLIASNGGKPPDRPYDDYGSNSDWTETWAEDGAAMARITWQRPVRMLVHADQMLRPIDS